MGRAHTGSVSTLKEKDEKRRITKMKFAKKLFLVVAIASLLAPATNVDYQKHFSKATILADGGKSTEYKELDDESKPIIFPKSIHITHSI